MLINGCIPAHTACHWQEICKQKKEGNCHHTGEQHAVSFSCGLARAFHRVDVALEEQKHDFLAHEHGKVV